MKYIWFLRTGEEQLFDLDSDPTEAHNLAGVRKYRKQLAAMRQAMAAHLAERGEEWVKDGQLQTRSSTMLYSPHYNGGK